MANYYAGDLVIKTKIENKEFKKGLKEVNTIISSLKLDKFDEIHNKLDLTVKGVDEVIKSINKFNSTPFKVDGFNSIKDAADKASKSVKPLNDDGKALAKRESEENRILELKLKHEQKITELRLQQEQKMELLKTQQEQRLAEQREKDESKAAELKLKQEQKIADQKAKDEKKALDLKAKLEEQIATQKANEEKKAADLRMKEEQKLADMKAKENEARLKETQNKLEEQSRRYETASKSVLNMLGGGMSNNIQALYSEMSGYNNILKDSLTEGTGLLDSAASKYAIGFLLIEKAVSMAGGKAVSMLVQVFERMITRTQAARDKVINVLNGMRRFLLHFRVDFSLTGLIDTFKDATKVTTLYESSLIGLNSILRNTGKGTSSAKKFLESYTDDGLVPMRDAIQSYKNLALYGWDTSQIEKVMVALKDTAAFGRKGTLSMGEALVTATDGIKNEMSQKSDAAGVTKNISRMWGDFAKSIGKGVQSLTEAERKHAVYIGILKEAEPMLHDAAKATKTYSGVMSMFAARVDAVKRSLGNFSTYIMKPMFEVFNEGLKEAIILIDDFRIKVNKVLTSFNIAEIQAPVMDDTEAALSEAEQAALDYQKTMEEVSKGTTEFDTINIQGGKDSGSGVPPKPGEEIPPIKPPEDSVKTETWIDGLKKKIKELTGGISFKPLKDAFKEIEGTLGLSWEDIGEKLEWLWVNILQPIVKWVIEEFAPVFAVFLANAILLATEAFVALEPILSPIFEMLGDVAIWIIEQLSKAFAWLAKKIKENPESFQKIAKVVGTVVGVMTILFNVLGFLAKLILSGLGLSFIGAKFTALAAGVPALAGIFTSLGVFFSNFGVGVLALVPIVGKVLIIIGLLILAFFAAIKLGEWLAEHFGEPIMKFFKETLPKFFKKFGEEALKIFVNSFTGMGLAVIGIITSLVNGIKDNFTKMWNWVKKYLPDNFVKAAESAWDSFTKPFKNIKNWFKDNVIDPLVKMFDGFIDGILDLPSKIGNGVKDFFTGGSSKPVGGGGTRGFSGTTSRIVSSPVNMNSIPHLAKGAVLPPNKPFPAMVSDQKRGMNVETPLDLMVQAFMTAIKQSGMGESNSDQVIHNVINLDGNVLYDSYETTKRRKGGKMY